MRRIRVKQDLDRHPLNDLDVVAGRVFGRQQAEPGPRSGLGHVRGAFVTRIAKEYSGGGF